MFMYAYDELNLYGSFSKHEILMVSDTFARTDIGGNEFGLKQRLCFPAASS